MSEREKGQPLSKESPSLGGVDGYTSKIIGTVLEERDSPNTAEQLSADDIAAAEQQTDAPVPADSKHIESAVSATSNLCETPPVDMGPVIPIKDTAQTEVQDERPKPEGRLERAWRERKLFIILSSIFLLLAILLVAGISYVYLIIHPFEAYDKILPNVYCAGVNLGGMTKDEAQKAIEEALRKTDYSVKVILPDCEYVFEPEQEGVALNGAQVARLAYAHGRENPSAYGIYRAYQTAKKSQYKLSAKTDLIYSREDIETLAAQMEKETYIAPTECTAEYDETDHIVTLTLGQPGRRLDQQTVTDAVSKAFENMEFEDIAIGYEKVEIDMTELQKLTGQCRSEYSLKAADPVIFPNAETHCIDLTMGARGWKLNGNALYTMAKEAVEREDYGTVTMELEVVEPAEVDITEAYSALACNPVEPYYSNGAVHEGSYGYTLDWDAAIAQILDSDYGDVLSIPMTPIEPKHTADEVRAVLFRDQLSRYSSPHTANSDRTYNLTLACQSINGTVINAGETFSFNKTVGERTTARGFRQATVYVGTESKEETGGGICQVASTIYDAALYAEMEIVSRAEHTFFVTYVPGGLDATVYWGALDFAFKNNTEYPIRVNASVSGGYVNISIDGTKTNDHMVKLDSRRLSTTPYSTVYKEDSSLPAGYQKETTYPYTGYIYEAYQYIYDGSGNLLDTKYLGKSTYQKRDRVITIGTG